MGLYRTRDLVAAEHWDGSAESALRIVAWVLERGGEAAHTPNSLLPGGGPSVVVVCSRGTRHLPRGWWVLCKGHGKFTVMSNRMFTALYEEQPNIYNPNAADYQESR